MSYFMFELTSTSGLRKSFALLPMVIFSAALVLEGCASSNWGAVACGVDKCRVETGYFTREKAEQAAKRACELASSTECLVEFHSEKKCIAVARGSEGSSVSIAGSKSGDEAKLEALNTCRQAMDTGCLIVDFRCR